MNVENNHGIGSHRFRLRHHVFTRLAQRLKETWWFTVGEQFQVSQEQARCESDSRRSGGNRFFENNDCVLQREVSGLTVFEARDPRHPVFFQAGTFSGLS